MSLYSKNLCSANVNRLMLLHFINYCQYMCLTLGWFSNGLLLQQKLEHLLESCLIIDCFSLRLVLSKTNGDATLRFPSGNLSIVSLQRFSLPNKQSPQFTSSRYHELIFIPDNLQDHTCMRTSSGYTFPSRIYNST